MVLEYVQRDGRFMRDRLKELHTRMKKAKLLKPLGRKERSVTVMPEMCGYLAHFFKDTKLRQVLALKEEQIAVGLVEGALEVEEDTEE